MSYNYINVNSLELLPNWDGVNGKIVNGYMFGHNTSFPLPEGTKEIWISYDEYRTGRYPTLNINTNKATIQCYNSQKYVIIGGKNYNIVNLAAEYAHCWIHIKSGLEDGLIEFYYGNKLIISYIGNIDDGEDLKLNINSSSISSGHYCCIKNLIISDTEIGKTETIISMPVTVETDMETTSTEGKYLITEHGQKYMMTPDIMKLAETFNTENIMIRRASIVSNSASSAFGNDISVLKATKNNETLAEIEMIENNDSQGIEHAFAVNQTVSDFSNDKYGWVAK